MTSKLSIITINLNNADGLRKTIESVILQTISDFEYIVIDGASTDGSVDIIKQYSDKITYWISEPDNGVYNAMNKGILKATGDYCLFLNSGDEFSSNKSLIKFNFFFDLNIDILYGDLTVKNGIEEYYKTYPDKLTFKYFRSDTLPHPASFIKRKLFHDICMFDEKLKICSDWEFFVIAICLRNCS